MKVGLLNKRRFLKRDSCGRIRGFQFPAGHRGIFRFTPGAIQRTAGERVSGYWQGILRGFGFPGGHSLVLLAEMT